MARRKGHFLSKALKEAATRFDGIFDKAGKPYIFHLLKVLHYLKSEDEDLCIIAVLHDFVEDIFKDDHEAGYAYLRAEGYSERVINGVRCLTKIKGEDHETYVVRVLSNVDAILVKLCDLRHNMDPRRLKGIEAKDEERMVKYMHMTWRLQQRLLELNIA